MVMALVVILGALAFIGAVAALIVGIVLNRR